MDFFFRFAAFSVKTLLLSQPLLVYNGGTWLRRSFHCSNISCIKAVATHWSRCVQGGLVIDVATHWDPCAVVLQHGCASESPRGALDIPEPYPRPSASNFLWLSFKCWHIWKLPGWFYYAPKCESAENSILKASPGNLLICNFWFSGTGVGAPDSAFLTRSHVVRVDAPMRDGRVSHENR